MEKKTVLTIVNVNEALPPIGSDVLISYDNGLTFPEEAQYSENRTCMLAGVGGSNVYFGKGWATNGSTCCGKGLILDPPTHWLKEQTVITISEEEAAQLESVKAIQERLKSEVDWTTPIDDVIHVPDELDPLINKIGFHVKLHTISKLISEEEMVCRIAFASQKFFSQFQPASPLDGWVDVKEVPPIKIGLNNTYLLYCPKREYGHLNNVLIGWFEKYHGKIITCSVNAGDEELLEATHYKSLPTPPTSKG